MLTGIERYNPENIEPLEHYVKSQAKDNFYDLEANLTLLKLYQFNPGTFKADIACLILLKALTNLPSTDVVLCKCFLQLEQMQEPSVDIIMKMHNMLERCQFQNFWVYYREYSDLTKDVKDFSVSVKRYISHVVNISYQKIEKATLATLL